MPTRTAVPEPQSRYPTLREQPKTRNIGDTQGRDWWKSSVRRQNGSKADGFGENRQTATDDAYKKAGGVVNNDIQHRF